MTKRIHSFLNVSPSVCASSRQLELHSPDAKHTVVLRCRDAASAQAWFEVMQSATSDLINKVITEVKEHTGRTGIAGSREIRHLGWLAEKVGSTLYFIECWCRKTHERNVLTVNQIYNIPSQTTF